MSQPKLDHVSRGARRAFGQEEVYHGLSGGRWQGGRRSPRPVDPGATRPTEAGEDIDYVAMPKASCQRASVLLYLGKAGYDIKLVHTDGFTRAMSQVKWSIPNPSGSTAVDHFDGPASDLLHQAVKDLRALYAIEPILSLLKDTFYGGGLGSSIAKSDLIDHDHEDGTHEGSSKVKQPICDIRERTMGLCSSNWKDPVHGM